MIVATSKFDKALEIIGHRGQIKFKKGRRTVSVRCPVHNDRNPSLSITEREDGELLVHCFAGCHYSDVLNALGIIEKQDEGYYPPIEFTVPKKKPKKKDKVNLLRLDLSELAGGKGFTPDYLQSFGIKQEKWHGNDAVYIPYFDLDGSRANRARYRLKKVTDDGEIKTAYFWSGAGDIVPYGLHKLDLAKEKGFSFLVEGETDSLTLWLHGLPALGIPGATLVSCIKKEHLAGIKTLYVMDEKDIAGNQFVKDVTGRLLEIGWNGDLYRVTMPVGIKDPNELHVQDRGNFIEKVEQIRLAGDVLLTAPEDDLIPLPKREKASEFPVSVFPKKTREFIELATKGLHTQPDLIGLHTLAALGSAIGNSREIEIMEGWTRRANLYACLIARPGSAKSRAQELATEPIESLQNEAFKQQKELEEEYALKYDAYENELNQWKRENRPIEDRPEEPTKPLLAHYFMNNSTTERLIQVLEYNYRGVAFVFDELNAWLQSMGQYKGGKGADKELYLSLWSNRTIKVDRVKDDGKSINVPKPFVSVFGNLPPDELPKMVTSEGTTGEGFIDRVLFSYPEEKNFAHLTRDGIPKQIRQTYKEVINKLYALQPASIEDGYMKPAKVRLSDQAWDLFKSWCDQQIDEINAKQVPERLVGVWRKMENQLASLTLIMHQLRYVEGEVDNPFEIDAVSMMCGMELADYFKAHAQKVFGQLGRTPADQRILDVLDWIKKQGGEVKKRDVQRDRIGGCKYAKDVDALFEELKELGYGRIEKVSPARRGPKSVVFKLFSTE